MSAGRLPQTPTLADVLRRLGPDLVGLVDAPLGLDRPVRAVVIAEAGHEVEEGELVAAVNLPADSHDLRDLVKRAGRDGATAVAVKASVQDLSGLAAGATGAGVALLAIAPEVGWHRAVALFTAASVPGQDAEAGTEAAIGDLFALAEATAVAAGGAVAIMDRHRRVLAFSSVEGQVTDEVRRQGILGRRVPPEFVAAHLDDRVWRTRRPQLVESPGAAPRAAIAVTAGREPLGSIWAISPTGTLTRATEQALIAAADIAALHLLKVTAAPSSLAWHGRESAVRAALLGTATEPPSAGAHIVLAAAPADDRAADVRAEQIAGLFAMLLGARPSAGCAIIDHVVHVLVPAEGSGAEEGAEALAGHAIRRCAEAFGFDLRVGIGGPDSRPERAREQAVATLGVLRAGTIATASFDRVRARIALRDLADLVAREHPLEPPGVAAMLACDRERSTEYARSVLAYLEHSENVAAAAATLYAHSSTVRYRIRRARELFGLDLEDPDGRLLTWLRLRLDAEA